MVDPEEQLAKFGVDAIRYFLLKEGSLSRDGGTLDFCDITLPLEGADTKQKKIVCKNH